MDIPVFVLDIHVLFCQALLSSLAVSVNFKRIKLNDI